MFSRSVICDKCEKKCVLDIDSDDVVFEVQGNQCDKGLDVAKSIQGNTKDVLTTLVRMKGGKCNVVSVKSSEPIDRSLFIECSKVLSRIYVGHPIRIGDVICKNILNTGVDIVATKNID